MIILRMNTYATADQYSFNCFFFNQRRIMPETTDQQPANTKPKQSAYLICEDAQCKCTGGSEVKAKLKVDSHKKAYINNNKLLATVKDITFKEGPKPFKMCSLSTSQDKSCTPKFEKWLKPYKDIDVEGNQVITDQSELLCLTWKGIVTIDTHGQVQEVNETQANNVDRNIATQVNPLADFVPLNIDTAKTVLVNSISGELVDDPKYKSVTGQQIEIIQSKKLDDHVDIYVRPGQEVKFKTVHKGEASLVCWKITGAKGPMHFLQHGPVYKTSFPEIGKYTIEGYGTGGDNNLDVDTKIVDGTVKGTKEIKKRGDDKECMLDVLVQDNKLTGIRHLPSENIIAGKVGDKSGMHVRIGVPVTFEPVYLMPPNQEEIDHLILVIKDASGNEVQRTKGKPNIIFAAQNSSAMYSVEAYFDNSYAKPCTYLFKTAANSVSVIAASGMKNEGDKIRTGTTLTFTVSKFKFENDDVQEELVHAELANIKWYESSNEPVAIGTTSYSKVYSREGKFLVTCAVREKSAGWFNTKKNEADDWNFTVTRNYPTAIEQKTEGKIKVGKKVIFELKSIFDVTYEDERTIHWQLTGPENKTLEKSHYFIFTPKQNGTYKLTVSMNEKSIDIPFECITCEIVNGWWTDSDGNILTGDDDEPSNTIGSAGWKQEVVAAFQHVGLNGEEVTLEVFDKDVNGTTSVYTKDIKVPDTKNAVTCSFQLDDVVKGKIKENSLSSSGLLYFTIKAKNGLKLINSGLALPKNENYLEVNDNVRVRAYFSDNNDTRHYSTAALDTPVYMQVKTKNLIDEELEFEIWSSKSSSKPLTSRYAFKVDKYGMASIKLNMKAFEPELPTPKDSTTAYFKIYIKKTGHQPFTGENKPKLTIYRTLATSPASIGTTKAFVVVDVSEGEKNNGRCPYCDEDLTSAILKSISSHASQAKIDLFLSGFNKTFKDFKIDTCLRKSHFLSQVFHESGSLKYTKEIGGENASYAPYYGRGLIQLSLEANYKAFGKKIGEDVYSTAENRAKIEVNPYAVLSAGFFWDNNELNMIADKDDFMKICRSVNGGFNGYEDRLKYLKSAYKNFKIEKCNNFNKEITDYKFEESSVYNSVKGSFAWGYWNDPGLSNVSSITLFTVRNKEESIKGYKRFLELISEDTNEKNWHGVHKQSSLSHLLNEEKDSSGNIKKELCVKIAAEYRLQQLQDLN